MNHYCYGSIVQWIYQTAAGLRPDDSAPGFKKAVIAPEPDARIGWLQARLDTRFGPVSAFWSYEEGGIRYDLETPVPALIRLGGEERRVAPGRYTFWTEDGRKDR
jgi:alpha-L-rhamnosidase